MGEGRTDGRLNGSNERTNKLESEEIKISIRIKILNF